MASIHRDKFFESTRGRIVLELRTGAKTVNDLAAKLDLTDNAIRANLLTLERDRLVTIGGSVRGHRKPHFSYELTDEARELFPKAYDSLLIVLLSELKNKLNPAALLESLRSVGRRIGRSHQNGMQTDLATRVSNSIAQLEELGGAARAEIGKDVVMIRSDSCPFAEAVSAHPEVCQVAEAMIQEIVGDPVKEVCDRAGRPKCCFEIRPTPAA
jgi:predicted ArsR family transcriptional regulator